MIRKFASGSSFRKYPGLRFPKEVTVCSQQRLFCNVTEREMPSEKLSVTEMGPLQYASHKIQLYAGLSKFRLSALVVVTSGAGYLAGGVPFDAEVLAATCVGTSLCAASANTFNQVFERDLDRKMKRTAHRPLPSGKLPVLEAVSWGAFAGTAGVSTLFVLTNPVVAALGGGNIFLYAVPYTFSKRYTEFNTWVGSVVGAIPPVMGWAAATGGDIMSLDAAALASILFLWQFPHFFALSWMYKEDYRRGGFQMVPVNDPTGDRTASLIWRYSWYLAALPPVVSLAGVTSHMFALEGTVISAYLLYLAQQFRQDHSNANARKVFLCSLWYLPVLLFGFVFHSRNYKDDDQTQIDENQFIVKARRTMQELCIHERFADGNELNTYCPKVVSDEVLADLENSEITVRASLDDAAEDNLQVETVSDSSNK